MKITRRSLTLLLAAAAFIPSFVNATTLADIEKNGVIRVGIPEDYPPFGFVGPDMKPQGYDIDMAGIVAKKLGVKLSLIPVTGPNRVPYLQSNKADLIISTLGETPERAKVIDFSVAYSPFILGVFGPKNLPISKVEELGKYTVGATRGGQQDTILTPIAPKGTVIKRFDDNATTITAYLSGQTQLIATANVIASQIAKQHPDKAPVLKITLGLAPNKIGVPKNSPELLNKVNAIVKEAYNDGTLEKLSEKWLLAPLPKEFKAE